MKKKNQKKRRRKKKNSRGRGNRPCLKKGWKSRIRCERKRERKKRKRKRKERKRRRYILLGEKRESEKRRR